MLLPAIRQAWNVGGKRILTQSANFKMTYELEKQIWTDKDFEQMGWHDCRIYKMHVSKNLELDIDYIFKWNEPELDGIPFTFWVAPATLIFKEIKNLTIELDTAFEDAVEIQDIEREKINDEMHWSINTHQGDFKFVSNEYEQFIRQQPFFQFGQTIPFVERNGLSLERTINQENPNRNREDVLQQREKDLEDYEVSKKRHLKREEKELLEKSREDNKIDTKTYLLKKKEINEVLNHYDSLLKDTRFENW
jgi:hypothetical protein